MKKNHRKQKEKQGFPSFWERTSENMMKIWILSPEEYAKIFCRILNLFLEDPATHNSSSEKSALNCLPQQFRKIYTCDLPRQFWEIETIIIFQASHLVINHLKFNILQASVAWLEHYPMDRKVHRFDSLSGHILRLRV